MKPLTIALLLSTSAFATERYDGPVLKQNRLPGPVETALAVTPPQGYSFLKNMHKYTVRRPGQQNLETILRDFLKADAHQVEAGAGYVAHYVQGGASAEDFLRHVLANVDSPDHQDLGGLVLLQDEAAGSGNQEYAQAMSTLTRYVDRVMGRQYHLLTAYFSPQDGARGRLHIVLISGDLRHVIYFRVAHPDEYADGP